MTELEILVTYDNHHIQAFDHDGVAIDAAPWFTNRSTDYAGERMTWGQFIRWADPDVEADHYHEHTGEWPHPSGPSGCSGPPRRPTWWTSTWTEKRGARRAQRGDAPLRDPGLRPHGARRRPRGRQPVGHAQGRLGDPAPRRRTHRRRRLVSAGRRPGRGHRGTSRDDARPEIASSRSTTASCTCFDADGEPSSGATTTPRQGDHVRDRAHGGRPQPGRHRPRCCFPPTAIPTRPIPAT
jgi:hypothetical protein